MDIQVGHAQVRESEIKSSQLFKSVDLCKSFKSSKVKPEVLKTLVKSSQVKSYTFEEKIKSSQVKPQSNKIMSSQIKSSKITHEPLKHPLAPRVTLFNVHLHPRRPP